MTYLHLLLPACSTTWVTYLPITIKKNQIACLAEHIREEAVDQNLPHIKIIPKEVWKRYRSSCHLPDSLSAVKGAVRQTGLKTSVAMNCKGTLVRWKTQATSVACSLWSHGVGSGVLYNCFSWGTVRAWILLSCKCSGLLRIWAHEWKWWRYHSSSSSHLSEKTLRHREWPCEHS